MHFQIKRLERVSAEMGNEYIWHQIINRSDAGVITVFLV